MRYFIFLALLFLIGCDETARGLPPGDDTGSVGVGPIFTTIGTYAAWASGIILALAPVAFVASFFVPALGGFRTLIVEIIICALILACAAVGLLWLGDNVWALVALLGLCVLYVIIRYWDFIVKLFAPIFLRKAVRLKTKKPTPV